MSGWIWMQGTDMAIADPIAPLDERDDRPSVKELIAKHRSIIEKVRGELSKDDLYDTSKHDDLWILRFLLSHKKKVSTALAAAKHTLVFRKEHQLDDKDLRAFAPHGKDQPVFSEPVQKMSEGFNEDTCFVVVPHRQRGVVMYLKIADIRQHTLVEKLTEDEWLLGNLYGAEWSFQWCDYVTRTTGRLTKSIRIVDVAGTKLTQNYMEFHRQLGKAAARYEDCYPQRLREIFVVNAPMWLLTIWRMLRPLFPKRVIEKVDFVDPVKREKERKRILKYIAEENLPERYGGTYKEWPLHFSPPLD